MIKKSGFTLAEILLSLGIIGVIAAMTLPTLTANTNASKFTTAFKKSVNQLRQAITMTVAIDEFDFRELVDSVWYAHRTGPKSFRSIMIKRLEGAEDITSNYFSKAGIKNSFTYNGTTYNLNPNDFYVYRLVDGTAVGYHKNAANCANATSANCVGFIDVNGPSNPNEITQCDDPTHNNYAACVISDNNVKDIFPIVFYIQTVQPINAAGKALLIGTEEDIQ